MEGCKVPWCRDCKADPFYEDYDTILLRDNSVPLHVKNLQLLMTGMFQITLNPNPHFKKEMSLEKQLSYVKKLP